MPFQGLPDHSIIRIIAPVQHTSTEPEGGMADSTGSMSGKTVLITGATAGIGEVAARELAGWGPGS